MPLVAERAVTALQGAFTGSEDSTLSLDYRITRSSSWSSDGTADEADSRGPTRRSDVPPAAAAANLSGILMKQRRRGLLHFWQPRWVELQGIILVYSKSKESCKQKTMVLRNFQLAYCAGRKFAFSLVDQRGKTALSLACSSALEQAAWWKAILAAQRNPSKANDSSLSRDKDVEWDGEVMARYQRVTCLGRGSTGKVWKVRDRETGDLLAMKMISKELVQRQNLEDGVMAERGILEHLRHPFVVTLHRCFQTATKLCFVLDYYSGGTLQDLVDQWTRIPEAVTRFYATEIALALQYLHSKNIIHRDLKLCNVLINGAGHAILTDFGIATSSSEAHTFCGTPHYLAPEVLNHQPYTKAVDWWCYGVTVYQMLTGTLPFVSQGLGTEATVYRTILNDDPNFQINSLSPAAITLLKGLLEKEPWRRTAFDTLRREPFFEAVDWAAAEGQKIPCPYIPDH